MLVTIDIVKFFLDCVNYRYPAKVWPGHSCARNWHLPEYSALTVQILSAWTQPGRRLGDWSRRFSGTVRKLRRRRMGSQTARSLSDQTQPTARGRNLAISQT